MPTIGTFVTGLPNTIYVYDVSIPSFTVAAAAVGSVFEITGSRRSVPISTVKNVTKANATNDIIAFTGASHISALITTNTTDATSIDLQYSTNGGSTWTTFPGPSVALTPASQNESVTYGQWHTNLTIEAAAAVTNPILLRAIVNDATDPTTDALTITNIRVTLFLIVMAP